MSAAARSGSVSCSDHTSPKFAAVLCFRSGERNRKYVVRFPVYAGGETSSGRHADVRANCGCSWSTNGVATLLISGRTKFR